MEVEIIPRFDYSTIDPATGTILRQKAERIKERSKRMADDFWDNGREFYEAQQALARYHGGTFQDWIRCEVGCSVRTAYNYINVYQKLSYANLHNLDVAVSALYLLADPNTPEEVRQETIQEAQNGKKIERKDVVSKLPPKTKKPRQPSSAPTGPRVESQALKGDPEMNQDPDSLYGQPTYRLELSCDEKAWRLIKRVFNPTWAAQVLEAAAGFEERELATILGIKRQEEPFYFD